MALFSSLLVFLSRNLSIFVYFQLLFSASFAFFVVAVVVILPETIIILRIFLALGSVHTSHFCRVEFNKRIKIDGNSTSESAGAFLNSKRRSATHLIKSDFVKWFLVSYHPVSSSSFSASLSSISSSSFSSNSFSLDWNDDKSARVCMKQNILNI